ncbi:HD domain-containing protein [uncultured Desulfovibrio sp.]|uniref:HD domain-containing protein n=3 Tax=uncultured Desulfovibrio sp. TaxID=167968 RepID=UPI0025FCD962|nr:HD domain-containing protein [uncultured Desulfovibrio sp.]
MHQALKDAVSICKTLLRNGYDAHVINAPLQERLLSARTPGQTDAPAVDIACEATGETLVKLFPRVSLEDGKRAMAEMEEDGTLFRFYPLEAADAGHPELSLLRVTPTMAAQMSPRERLQLRLTGFGSPTPTGDQYEGFEDLKGGDIRLVGLPDETLRHDYLLAVRALRFAANFDAPIEPNTWMAIVRASVRVNDYVPARDIMEEWRKVAAESMFRFVRLLYEAHILQGLIPEVAALVCVPQQNDKGECEGNVFEHTLKCMEHYPEEGFHYDWLGAMAMLFHDVGKLFTAEYFDGRWTYYQHHRVGAKVTRKILRRLHFAQEDADLICHLVNHHMRFHFMMTDRGIRRFKAVGETPRLIAMARADLQAREDSFTSFNHNMKYLGRAETPEQMLEPLLNGNEIMEETRLSPGPLVGVIRDALLQAQIAGEVTDRDSALAFVRQYAGNAAAD